MTIHLVVYRDDEGLYGQAFSTLAKAEAFKASFPHNEDFVIVSTMVDQSLALLDTP